METFAGMFTKRNVFDLTHEKKFSCDMGQLIPIMLEEVLPGDSFQAHTEMIVRLSPLLAPVMHRMNVFTHYFFVPIRLIWDNWQKFITGDTSGNDATVAPTITSAGGYAAKSLGDYLGLPISIANTILSALPFRAYDLIYNEWYRDQNLQSALTISKADGADTTTNVALQTRNWEKDYFTTALPWPQRGTAVTVPLGTTAPVVFDTYPSVNDVHKLSDNTDYGAIYTHTDATMKATGVPGADINTRISDDEHRTTAHADISNASAIDINTLRLSFQVQKWMERNARSGVRYIESILAHFGVISSDARLQRPEFLGGGKSQLIVSEVLQTSSTDTNTSSQTALGTMAGHGFSALQSHAFKKSFEEHGYIIGIMSIMPRTAYQQGIARLWNRSSRYDYYWPEFAHLGEQAVLLRELYYQGSTTPDTSIFGYQGRYDEYRRRESTVHGDFRTTLNFWHLGRIFSGAPTLNSAFVTADPTKRPFAVTSENVCWVQLLNNVKAVRPLPITGEPGLIDHN